MTIKARATQDSGVHATLGIKEKKEKEITEAKHR